MHRAGVGAGAVCESPCVRKELCRSHECLFQTVIHTLRTASWLFSLSVTAPGLTSVDLCHYAVLRTLTAPTGVSWVVKIHLQC